MNVFGGVYPYPPAPEPRVKYSEVPPAAPRPRLWKKLMAVAPFLVDVHYALERWPGGDLDIDTEAELREEMAGVVNDMASRGAFVPDDGVMFQRTARSRPVELMVRVIPSDPVTGPYGRILKN